jgi:hypothetical protein
MCGNAWFWKLLPICIFDYLTTYLEDVSYKIEMIFCMNWEVMTRKKIDPRLHTGPKFCDKYLFLKIQVIYKTKRL